MNEKKKEVAITTLKGLIGAIPYVGSAINESVFEHRSRVKQKRVNEFIESLANYIQDLGVEISETEHIKSDEFGDVFEAILRKVSITSSKEKASRFRKLIANQILNSEIPNFVDTYIDIIGNLNDVQMKILIEHYRSQDVVEKITEEIREKKSKIQRLIEIGKELADKELLGRLSRKDDLSDNINLVAIAEGELSILEDKSRIFQLFRRASFYQIGEGDFLFFKQDLVAKGLLKDIGLGTHGGASYQSMQITEFATGLLKYLEEDVSG